MVELLEDYVDSVDGRNDRLLQTILLVEVLAD